MLFLSLYQINLNNEVLNEINKFKTYNFLSKITINLIKQKHLFKGKIKCKYNIHFDDRSQLNKMIDRVSKIHEG